MPMHIEQPASRHSAPAAWMILCQSPRFRIRFDLLGTWHDQHAHTVGNLSSFENACRRLDIREAAVGAAADEHDIDRRLPSCVAGHQLHVIQCLAEAGIVALREQAHRCR